MILEALALLELSTDARCADVKAAHRARVWEVHPDHGGDADAFAALNSAYAEALAWCAVQPCPACKGAKILRTFNAQMKPVDAPCSACAGTGLRG